jgi:hypothetical protein
MPSSLAIGNIHLLWPNVLGARALWPPSFLIGHGLPDPQRFDCRSLQGAVMEEQFSALSANEPKSFVRDQFLNRALRHHATPS